MNARIDPNENNLILYRIPCHPLQLSLYLPHHLPIPPKLAMYIALTLSPTLKGVRISAGGSFNSCAAFMLDQIGAKLGDELEAHVRDARSHVVGTPTEA